MRILYVLGDVPAMGTGGYTRTAGTVRALARFAEVELIYPDRPTLTADERLGDLDGVRVAPVRGRDLMERAWSGARLLAAGRPPALARAVKPALRRALAAAMLERPPEVLVADQLAAALTCLLAGVQRSPARTVYNANNVEWELRRSVGGRERLRWLGLRRLERTVLRAFDEAWMVSERDRDAAQALAPAVSIRVVPNALDVAAIDPVRPAAEPVVLFVGSFDYPPNRIGLDWLARRVMPEVWRRRPDVRLDVVGRWRDRAWEPPDERVTLHGFVPDLGAAYARARCCAAPLLAAGGTPLKVIEALAYGLPLVATTAAVRGLNALASGRHLLVADAPEAFAYALLELLDPGYDHGERAAEARAAVERSYSLSAVADALAGALSA